MLRTPLLSRAARACALFVALLASVATSAPGSSKSATTTVELVAGAPGTPVVRTLAIDVAGHPALTGDRDTAIEVRWHHDAPAAFEARLDVVGPDGATETSARPDVDGGTTALEAFGELDWLDATSGPFCPTEGPCTRTFSIALENSDPARSGTPVVADVTVHFGFDRDGPPPGTVVVREVVP